MRFANRIKAFLTIRALAVVGMTAIIALASSAQAARIRDVARLKNEQPNELQAMGLVIGLKGTGDGGENPAARMMLKELLKKFDSPVALEKELKNANNVAIVNVSVAIPAQGAHAGDKLDVKVTSLGSAKSIKGGRLFITPLIAPNAAQKIVLGWASGEVKLDDENQPTSGTIIKGGVLIEDILPEEIKDRFTLVLRREAANAETASAMADQINEDVSPQTGGRPVAFAVDGTSVNVMIPKAEQANPTAFVARIRSLPLPTIPGPAKVTINTKTKTIIFTEEVELAPTMISHGGLTITVAAPKEGVAGSAGAATPAGGQVPFVALDPHKYGAPKLKDLETAFNLLKVGPDDRIAIVRQLHEANVLKCELVIE